MLSLPREISLSIIVKCDLKSYVAIYSSNKLFYNVCQELKNNDEFWKKLYRNLDHQRQKFNEKYWENVYYKYFEYQKKRN
jgi:hypothetical protein